MTTREPGRAAWRTFGASVRGPGHAHDGRPNQDAWLSHQTTTGTVVAVCDGIGSHLHADRGARAACRAVAEAARIWARTPEASPPSFLRLVHAVWTMRVAPVPPEACGTTCLIAYAAARGPLFVAQLGDGMIAVSVPGRPTAYLDPEDRPFSNVTTGLGTRTGSSEWRWLSIDAPPSGTVVLLTTDGVADDLAPERRDDFVGHVHDTYAPLPASHRWRRCAQDLRAWPVAHHTDDKTLALLWRTPTPPAHAHLP